MRARSPPYSIDGLHGLLHVRIRFLTGSVMHTAVYGVEYSTFTAGRERRETKTCWGAYTPCYRMDGILKALGFESKPDYTEKIPENLTSDHFSVHNVSWAKWRVVPTHVACLGYFALISYQCEYVRIFNGMTETLSNVWPYCFKRTLKWL